LAALLGQSSSDAAVEQVLKHASFQRASSDARFDALIERLRASAGNDDPMRLIRNQSGKPVIRVERSAHTMRLIVDLKIGPGLDEYLLNVLPDLVAGYDKLP
jgi:hypothetical protein